MSIEKVLHGHSDWSTTNQSAIALANMLIEQGVKNSSLPLRLLDVNLIGVDPFADDLTGEMQARIVVECRDNPIYFFREIVRIPVPGGLVSFRMDELTLATIWSMYQGVDMVTRHLELSGCGRITTALHSWSSVFGEYTRTCAVYCNHHARDASHKRSGESHSALPVYLKRLAHNEKNSVDFISPTQDSVLNVGRFRHPYNMVTWSKAELIKDMDKMYPTAMCSTAVVKQRVRENKTMEPCGSFVGYTADFNGDPVIPNVDNSEFLDSVFKLATPWSNDMLDDVAPEDLTTVAYTVK